MEPLEYKIAYPFLQGGGELGALIRDFDWSKASIGTPDRWPQSLRISLANVLNSGFPMFLFWGDDLVCFYNDAFRPSLGVKGKHPAIGKKGKDVWEEIWDFIGPLIDGVLTTGEPVWFKDQLVPFYRNGRLEDIYWTFSYSLIVNDEGLPGGVLVTCMETTETVAAFREVAESESRFRTMAEGTDVLIAVSDETGNAIYFNNAWVELTGRPMEDLLRFGWVDLVHEEDRERYVNIYLTAFEKREPFTGEFRVLSKEGEFRWLLAKGPPRFRGDGAFAGYISSCVDITERKKAELAILESETRLELLSNTVPAMIFYLDAEQRYQSYNETFMRWFGVNEAEAIGKNVREFIGEEDYHMVLPHLLKAYAGEQERFEMNAPSKIGAERWLSIVYTPHKSAEGLVLGLIVLVIDITQSKQTELALRESEARFRSLIEEAPIATSLFVGRELVIEIANPRMIELWGKGPEILGKTLADALPELQGQPFLQLLDDVFTTGKTFEAMDAKAELEVKGKLHTYYFDFTYKPIRNTEGEVYAILEMAEDVTDQVLARQALKKSEENLRNMILQSPVAMAILKGPSFIVELANDRMFELWGRGKEELLQKSIFEGLPEAKDQGYEELISGVFTTGKTFSALGIPVTLPRHGNVETVYINLLYEAFREGDGTISGIMVVATDVTQQVLAKQKIEEVVTERTKELAQANEALLNVNRELQRSNQNLEEFAHAASHDLKEPVRKIHFFTQKLKEQLSTHLKEEEALSFNRIQNATKRMGNLIDDLLLYS
ncbi:MAG TPA: PAS domain S-box protein, partial [Flavisolibacter sp.]|nr:PAS domain S-box protein [Flavisolibacter sp.]